MKKIIFFILVVVCISETTQAQNSTEFFSKGYLILNNGDTISGYIKKGFYKLNYRPSREGKTKRYAYSEVKAYKNRYKYYYRIEGYLYLHAVKGKINLYTREVESVSSGQYGGFHNYNKYHAVKKDDEEKLTLLYASNVIGYGKKYFRKTATAYFADNPEIVAKIKDKTFNHKNIEKLITAYNVAYITNKRKEKLNAANSNN